MTIAQASALIGRQIIGLPSSFGGTTAEINALPIETKMRLTSALGDYIRAHPGLFTAQQVSVAASMASQDRNNAIALAAPQQQTAWVAETFSALGESAYNTIGAPLAAVGNGVSSAVETLGKLLPFAALIAAFLVTKNLIDRTK